MKAFILYSAYKYLIFIIVLSSIVSCAVKVPLANNYFNNQKTLGVIYFIEPIDVFKDGEQGYIENVLTPGNKFIEPLKIIDKKINPRGEIKNLYKQLLNTKGKSYVELEFEQYLNKFEKFEKLSSTKREYYQYDLRTLKSHFINGHEIDEVLIVSVKYGLWVYYDGLIVFKKMGECIIESEMIDLNDNSIIYHGYSVSLKSIKGRWDTPPEYENLSYSIKSAISTALAKHKVKLNKL